MDEGYDAGIIVINGAGGAGVDIFFSLPIEHMDATKSENYMVFLDQRKRVVMENLPVSTAKSLITKARAAYNKHTHTAVGLFSLFPRASFPSSDLPPVSFVFSKAQTKAHYGSFWSHPAACPFVDVQEDNSTTLCLLLKGGSECRNDAKDGVLLHSQAALAQFLILPNRKLLRGRVVLNS